MNNPLLEGCLQLQADGRRGNVDFITVIRNGFLREKLEGRIVRSQLHTLVVIEERMHGELRNTTFHIRGESDVTSSIERNAGEINREGNALLAEVNNDQVITGGENCGTGLIPTCYQ